MKNKSVAGWLSLNFLMLGILQFDAFPNFRALMLHGSQNWTLIRRGPSSHPAPGPAPSSPTPHNSNRVTQLALDHRQEEKLEEVQALPGPSSGALPLQANTGDGEAASTRAGSDSPVNTTLKPSSFFLICQGRREQAWRRHIQPASEALWHLCRRVSKSPQEKASSLGGLWWPE